MVTSVVLAASMSARVIELNEKRAAWDEPNCPFSEDVSFQFNALHIKLTCKPFRRSRELEDLVLDVFSVASHGLHHLRISFDRQYSRSLFSAVA